MNLDQYDTHTLVFLETLALARTFEQVVGVLQAGVDNKVITPDVQDHLEAECCDIMENTRMKDSEILIQNARDKLAEEKPRKGPILRMQEAFRDMNSRRKE